MWLKDFQSFMKPRGWSWLLNRDRVNVFLESKMRRMYIFTQFPEYAAWHYNDVIMSAMASQITDVLIVYRLFRRRSRKHQSSVSLAIVRGIRQWAVNSMHKGTVTRKIFLFDDVIMFWKSVHSSIAVSDVCTPMIAVVSLISFLVSNLTFSHFRGVEYENSLTGKPQSMEAEHRAK